MRRFSLITLLSVILLGIVVSTTAVFAGSRFKGDTLVETGYGYVDGYIDAVQNVLVWKGIPYAKPPVGELRWKAPLAPEPWPGVRDATQSCSECTQMFTTPQWVRTGQAIGSEDCLYLDIYRPLSKHKNLPVYVWIHGGSNNFGTAKDYDGATLATTANMLVVVLQYRLGPLGWLTHPALRHGNPLDDSGNFGTLDTVQALKWIQQNIAAFGGNPGKVTIAGESAGAHNVMNLVITPLAAGLFHGAISQSGGMTTDTVAEGEDQADDLIEALLLADRLAAVPDDDVETYLRSKTGHELMEAYFARFRSLPTYDAYQDGHVLPGSVVATIRSGNYNKVPVILGANQYETKAFMPLYGPAVKYVWGFSTPSSPYTWFNLIDVLDGSRVLDDVLPTQTDKDVYEICGYYGSLAWRAKFVDEIARAMSRHQNDVYAYLFKWGGDSSIGSGPHPFDFIYGAGHAMEIPFFFGSSRSMWGYAFSPGNDTAGRQALSKAMVNYAGQFVNSGNPNGKGLPPWRKWSNKEGHDKIIYFDADYDEALIRMDNQEVTFDQVYAELGAAAAGLPPELRALPWYFLWSQAE